MPLTQPSSGGISRYSFLISSSRFSDLLDISIAFRAVEYDPVNKYTLISGDNTFCGTLPSMQRGKISEFVSQPSSVIANGNVDRIHRNGISGGIIVKVASNYALSNDGGVSWSQTIPGSGQTEVDLLSWRDSQLVNCHRLAGTDLRISSDNGLTYPDSLNTGLGGTNRQFCVTTQDDKVFMVLADSGSFAWTSDANMITALFNTFPIGTFAGFNGNVTGFAANGDSSKGVMVDALGNVLVSIDGFSTWTVFDKDKNYFKNSAGNFNVINDVVYVADIKGFIIGGTDLAAYIPEDGALDSMTVVSILTGANIRSMTSDGVDIVATSATNNLIIQMPFKN